MTGQHQQARITSLEAEVTHLRQFIGGALQYNQEITGMFKSLLATFVSNHRETRSSPSVLDPSRIGELSVEGATDSVNEYSVGGSGLQPARLFERQDALDPSRALVTVGALGAFTPHDGKAQGALCAVIRGFNSMLQEKDPQRVHLAEQVADQLSGLIFAIMVASDQVAQSGIPGSPLPPGGWGVGHVTQALELGQGPFAARSDMRVAALR